MRWLLVAHGVLFAGASLVFCTASEVDVAPVLPRRGGEVELGALESRAALSPSATATAALAAAYLERNQPGLAAGVIEGASADVQSRPEVGEVYARALFHRGRSRQALAVAREAERACTDGECPAWLIGRTGRQVAFLEEVVAAGIEDPYADLEGTRAAYQRSSREVRLVALR